MSPQTLSTETRRSPGQAEPPPRIVEIEPIGRDRLFFLLVAAIALSVVASLIVVNWVGVEATPSDQATTSTSAGPSAVVAGAPRTAPSVSQDPTAVGSPIGTRGPQLVSFDVETIELEGQLADGATFTYWTFDGTVPGPMLRARVGDTVEINLINAADSTNVHSIDLHAVNGPGGGAMATQVPPGESGSFRFQALNPGVYVYHCATPHVPTHIANGMYGLIVIEPDGGLDAVDREFYVMQGEIYTAEAFGSTGALTFDADRLLLEEPNFVVFNGAASALTGDNAMQVDVGDTVRLYVGNGGPNLISSFHVIGEIFDRVHVEGARDPAFDVQTTLIPAGGATWVEFTVDVPGNYLLVDHALSRVFDKGALAIITATGPEDPTIFTAP